MNQFKTDINGGLPVFLDDIRFMDAYNRDTFKGMASAFGLTKTDSYRLSGAVATITGTDVAVTAGYICLEGEVYPVAAHSLSGYNPATSTLYWDVYEIAAIEGDKTFESTSVHSTYIIRTAVVKKSIGLLTAGTYMPHNAPLLLDKIRLPILNKVDKGIDWNMPITAQSSLMSAREASRPVVRGSMTQSGLLYIEFCFGASATIAASTVLATLTGVPGYVWQKSKPCIYRQNGSGFSAGTLDFQAAGTSVSVRTLSAIASGYGIQDVFVLIP